MHDIQEDSNLFFSLSVLSYVYTFLKQNLQCQSCVKQKT